MTKHTGRDEAWDYILSRAVEGAAVTPGEVDRETAVSDRTARDVLDTMTKMDWLDEQEQDSRTNEYEAGDRIPQTLFTADQ